MSNLEMKVNAITQVLLSVDSDTHDAAMEMLRTLNEPETQKPAEGQNGLTWAIENILTQMGMPNHVKGFRYTVEAIRLAVEDPEILDMITKRLYPSVAKAFGTTGSRAERAIRHAIELVWERIDFDMVQEHFGCSIDPSKGKTTNSEFIARIAGIVRQRMREAA